MKIPPRITLVKVFTSDDRQPRGIAVYFGRQDTLLSEHGAAESGLALTDTGLAEAQCKIAV